MLAIAQSAGLRWVNRMLDFNITDLETRGFLVVKNFLTDSEIQQRLQDYQVAYDDKENGINITKNVLLKSGRHGLEPKIIEIVEKINQLTNIKIDLIGPNGRYFDTTLAEIGWHQDHEPYYNWQTGYHLVNFWMPLVKPSAEISGLKVVPMDVLRLKIGDLFEKRILNQGAKRFMSDGDVTHGWDDEHGDTFDLPVNIDTIAETPLIEAGDVLLIRGDVIHATQDNLNHRITLSVRTVDGNHYVNRQQFQTQCDFKKFVFDSTQGSTKRLLDRFASGQDQIQIHDLFTGRIQKEK